MRIVCIFLFLFYLPANNAWSCGINLPQAVCSKSNQPDEPIENFSGGNLGILRSTFPTSYLIVAYRYFKGSGLDRKNQQEITDYWHNNGENRNRMNDSNLQWFEIIKNIPGTEERSPEPFRPQPHSHNWYLNCAPDAFQAAIRTFTARTIAFGENSPEVQDWLLAQKMVFENCERGPSIPLPASEGMPLLIKQDREYQIAAAYFYSEQFAEAERLFREIAEDESSPWSMLAPYLVVRTMSRKADLDAKQVEKDDLLSAAKTELQNILKNDRYKNIHQASKHLLNTINFRLNPGERMTELSGELLTSHEITSFIEKIDDFLYMSNIGTKSDSDLAVWIHSYQQKDFSTALKKWQQTHMPHWLLAALEFLKQNDPNLMTLLSEADKIDAKSPLALSIAYQSIRLMIQSGRREEAEKKLEPFLAQKEKTKLTQSDINSFVSLKMQLSKNLEEFVANAKRKSTGVIWPVEKMPLGDDLEKMMHFEMFFQDSTWILNHRFSLSILVKILEDTTLPENLRKQIIVAAWTRAVLLEREDIALKLAVIFGDLFPEQKDDINTYLLAKNKKDRDFAFAYFALRTPGVQPEIMPGFGRQTGITYIDSYRDNWWCGPRNELKGYKYNEEEKSIQPTDFMNEEERNATNRELEALSEIVSGPIYLGRIVLEYAQYNPKDSRVAEALHLTVRATRYGCSRMNDATSEVSKAAFVKLHRKYPDSVWTQKTPYWF